MAVDGSAEARIREWEERLARAVDGQEPLTLSPAWWQERLLDWATNDPAFRVKLLRFVDVLPTLRSASSIADHVRQYFRSVDHASPRTDGRARRDSTPVVIQTASGLAAQPVFRPILSRVVRQGVFSMAHRFIAGETPEAAVKALRELAERGVASTVDLLGEETLSDVEADAYLARYMELLETLATRRDEISPRGERWEGVPAVNISVKVSALCPHLEPAAPEYVSEIAGARLRPLLRLALQHGAFINFDMEQYRNKDLVQRVFADLVTDPEFSSFPHLGIVVQAYLRDAVQDVARYRELAERRGTPIAIRLVKGAYWDEERIVAAQNSWPLPVFDRKSDTDASFEACTDELLRSLPHLTPAFASHNPRSVAEAIIKARDAGLTATDLEFQTLFGMAEGLRTAVAEAGYRTRVYVPVGQVIPGMAYLVRRLLENTSNQAWFNAGAILTRPEGATGPETGQTGQAGHVGRTGRREGLSLTPAEASEERAAARYTNAAPAAFFHKSTREEMRSALERTRKRFGQSYPLLIGDRRVSKRPTADVHYPADPGTTIGRIAQATAGDVDAAVDAGREAFPAWRERPARERGDILRRAAELVEERRFDLAATMVFESAKPWHEADGDVCEAIDYLRYYAAEGERLSAPQPMGDLPGEENEYFHEGRGVTAVIAPWNFPLAIITGMGVAAIAGGNVAILKPAAQSPIIACKLVEILREAGIPDGVVQYLPGPGGEVGRALVEHPAVANIAFTGSSAVGLGIIEAAARAHALAPTSSTGAKAQQPGPTAGAAATSSNDAIGRALKRVVAEMGGKNAIIIDDDADLDQAVHGVVTSAFGYAGQKCSACSRLILVGSAYEEALERLKNAVASLVVGPPHDPATFVPPVIGADARDRIMAYIESGRSYANLLVQADAPSGGYYVSPTVFTDVPLDSPLAREEIFGPVLSVFRAKDFEESLRMAVHSDFALTGGLFSRNPRHIEAARREFRTGNLYINRKITGAIVGRQPFGGLAMSGVGEKAGGPDYVRQFMQPRMVTENTMRRGFAPEDGA